MEFWGARPVPAEALLDRPVWVDLEVLFGPPPADAVAHPDAAFVHGLRVTGRVPGVLARWGRSADGRWIGIVTFTLEDQHGAAVVRHERVAVPAAALAPREVPPRR